MKLQNPSYAAYHGNIRNPDQEIMSQSFKEKLFWMNFSGKLDALSGENDFEFT